MKKRIVIYSSALVLALTGCGGMNAMLAEKTTAIEYYRIFDLKSGSGKQAVMDAAFKGLARNTSSIEQSRPIPAYSNPPPQPGRFTVSNPLKGSNMALLMGANAGQFKVASCEGAAYTAKAIRSQATAGNQTTVFACLWEYQDGYHLDFYANFIKKEGGLGDLSRAAAAAMVGTPEEWVEKVFNDTVKEIARDTSAQVTYLEGYPQPQGTPWFDR